MTKTEREIKAVKKELKEIKGMIQQLVQPSNDGFNTQYIKDLARKGAAGDKAARKEHNRMKKLGLI